MTSAMARHDAHRFDIDGRQIILHVGYKKCASTFLQKGIFPHLCNVCDLAHDVPLRERHYIMEESFDPEVFRGIVRGAVRNRDDDCGHVFVSWEDFVQTFDYPHRTGVFKGDSRNSLSENRFRKILTNLHAAFPAAKIVIIIREQRDLLLSYFRFHIQASNWNTESIAGLCRRYEASFSHYDRCVRSYADTFGRENVRVVPYELLKEDRERFIEEVLSFTKGKYTLSIPEKRINASSKYIVDTYPKMIINRIVNALTPFDLLLKTEGITIGGRPFPRIVRNVVLDPLAWCLNVSLGAALRRYYAGRYGPEAVCAISGEDLKSVAPVIRESNRRLKELTGLDLSRYGYLL